MAALTLDIARVKNYIKHPPSPNVGVNIDNEIYSDYFRISDDLTFSFWVFDFPQPSIQQLRINYPDTHIKFEIALRQLRGYRNRLLLKSDKFVTPDYPISLEQKNQILNWRQELRDLPETIDSELLTLDETGRFNKSLIPELGFMNL